MSEEDARSVLASELPLGVVYEGWEGYQISLKRAIGPLRADQLAYRPLPTLRSVGEIAAHISLGRIGWFSRMQAPGAAELFEQLQAGSITEEGLSQSASDLVEWLDKSWEMVGKVLDQWTVADLAKTYLQSYQGKNYAVSRQWTIWRIMAHDIHHGGQITAMLYAQGLDLPELGDLGGHLTEPPLEEQA